jgi:hypothetical protein
MMEIIIIYWLFSVMFLLGREYGKSGSPVKIGIFILIILIAPFALPHCLGYDCGEKDRDHGIF